MCLKDCGMGVASVYVCGGVWEGGVGWGGGVGGAVWEGGGRLLWPQVTVTG